MKMRIKSSYKRILLAIMFLMLGCSLTTQAQLFKKVTGKKNKVYKDSLKTIEYPFIFPLWGDKMMERGFDVPYPTGMGINFFWQEQDTEINDLAVSFGDSEDIDISDLVAFEYIRSSTQSVSFRPDLYIFPFLNVYAIINKVYTQTDVKLSEPFELEIPQVSNEGIGGGFGINLSGGIGPGWFAVNTNWAWTQIKNLERPTPSFVTALRLGMTKHSFDKQRYFAFWVGANYQNYNSDNRGSYDMLNLLPDDQAPLEELKEKIEEMRDGFNEKYEDWCSQPGNGPKCNLIDPILEELANRIDDKLDGIEPPEELRIGYAFSAAPAQKWNMLAGFQYHASKRFQFRGEVGFLGARRSYLLSANYRFGIKRRKS